MAVASGSFALVVRKRSRACMSVMFAILDWTRLRVKVGAKVRNGAQLYILEAAGIVLFLVLHVRLLWTLKQFTT
jgi:biotin carboxyl carrier protein